MVRAAWALLAAASLGGCAVIAGLDQDFQPPGSTAGTGGSGGVGGAGGAGGGPGCDLKKPPPPPMGATPGGATAFVVALRDPDVGEAEDGIQNGYDFDGVCTDCEEKLPKSCEPITPTKDVCDSSRGVDNAAEKAFGELAQGLGAFSGAVSQVLDQGVKQGQWTLLIQVSGYNDAPDDPDLVVTVYATTGLGSVPTWNGTDTWPIDETSVGAAYTSTEAYVSGGVLVARLPRVPVHMRGTYVGTTYRLDVDISSAVLVGELSGAAPAYSLISGTIAGTWLVPDAFGALSSFRENDDATICMVDANGMPSARYVQIKSSICDNLDLSTTPPDGSGALPQCDGMSFGMSFNASPAMLGPAGPPPPPSPGCPMGDPATDSCAL